MIWEIKMPVQVSVYVYAYVCLFVDDERMIGWFGGGEDGCQWALTGGYFFSPDFF